MAGPSNLTNPPATDNIKSRPATIDDTRNLNGVDPAAAAKAAAEAAAKSTSVTLKEFVVLHAKVGEFPEGTRVSVDEMGGIDNLPRLFGHGAIRRLTDSEMAVA